MDEIMVEVRLYHSKNDRLSKIASYLTTATDNGYFYLKNGATIGGTNLLKFEFIS